MYVKHFLGLSLCGLIGSLYDPLMARGGGRHSTSKNKDWRTTQPQNFTLKASHTQIDNQTSLAMEEVITLGSKRGQGKYEFSKTSIVLHNKSSNAKSKLTSNANRSTWTREGKAGTSLEGVQRQRGLLLTRRLHLSVEVTEVPAQQQPSPTEDTLLNEVTHNASTRKQATRCLHLQRKRFQHLNLREEQRQNRTKASRPRYKYKPCCERTPCDPQQSADPLHHEKPAHDLDVGDVRIIRLKRCASCTRSSDKGKGCNSDDLV